MNKHVIFLVLTLCMAGGAAAQTDTTVVGRIRQDNVECRSVLQLAWQNPAVKQWQHDHSLSDVTLAWQLRHEDEALVSQQGDHESVWAFDAQTYMKHGTSTLWGRAYYNNGRQEGIRWNETSDPGVVYPYLLADSVEARAMKLERYSFMGGYADVKGRLAWGVTIGYTAGLYYRNVDPRPRNVTADLDIAAGVGYHFGNYATAASVMFKKYKQTNNVAFYSEMGNDKIFHLTGLTGDYGRFAGTGYNTYYKGYRWAASLNLHPVSGRGLNASMQVSRMALDNVLTSLNKLPMAQITHNAIDAEAAWLNQSWALRATVSASRRVGTENIFGDPAAQVYQQIGSLDNYHENRFATGIEALWLHKWRQADLQLRPGVDYRHINTIYADPKQQVQLNDIAAAMFVKGGVVLGKAYASLTLGATWSHPLDNTMMLNDVKRELTGLQRLIEHDFAYWSHNHIVYHTSLAVNIPISDNYALRASLDWKHGNYTASNHTDWLNTSLSFVF